jgi:ABC-2 type transport system permease protein
VRKILAVAVKELRQASRDPLSLLLLLGMPAAMLLLYGYAVNFDVRHVRLAVEDRDRSAASRDLAASFVNSTYFDLVADLPAGADFERLFERRIAKAVLVIPERFSRDLAAGRTARVQLILDGSDANTATTVLGYASNLVAAENVLLARSRPGSGAIEAVPVGYEPRVWYNPELKSTLFLVPGLIGFIMMVTTTLSTALSVVREKERGTMEQLRATSLHPAELIVGKTLPYLGISLAATAVILVAARLLFGLDVRGSYLDLFLATFVYLVGGLGWGLLVSSFSGSQAMAFQVGILSSMLPAIFLSGFIFTIRSMPDVLQAITRIVPARYYLVIVRGVILKGGGLGAYLPEFAFLGLFAALVLGVASARLIRREV